MLDLFFVALTVLFLVVAWAFMRGCDRLQEDHHETYSFQNGQQGVVGFDDQFLT
jgi:hypothetical protein